MDCGPTFLYMIGRYYGRVFSLEKLRELTAIGKEGVSLIGISAAEKIGSQTNGVQLSFTKLMEEAPKPTILHWGQNHFVVLLPPKRTFFSTNKYDKITMLRKFPHYAIIFASWTQYMV